MYASHDEQNDALHALWENIKDSLLDTSEELGWSDDELHAATEHAYNKELGKIREKEQTREDEILLASLKIEATPGTPDWWAEIDIAALNAQEESDSGERRMERWADSRMSGQSQEGYYSDEGEIHSRPGAIYAMQNRLKNRYPLQWMDYCEAMRRVAVEMKAKEQQ